MLEWRNGLIIILRYFKKWKFYGVVKFAVPNYITFAIYVVAWLESKNKFYPKKKPNLVNQNPNKKSQPIASFVLMELKKFIHSLKLPIKQFQLYEQAFIHKSFFNEHSAELKVGDYECLEFLGDSVLSSVISRYLYSRVKNLRKMVLYKHYLAGNEVLARVSKDLGLDRFIKTGKGMNKETIISPSVLADVFEAFIAAIFINGTWNHVYKFASKHLLVPLFDPKILEFDFKTILQERAMKELGILPKYTVLEENKTFIAYCELDGQKTLANGVSKKTATKEAAHLMLLKRGWIKSKF